MVTAIELFEDSISWLKQNYVNFTFFVERDIVWSLQTYLLKLVKKNSLPYLIFNDYPILPGSRRSFCADIAVVNDKNENVEVAAEFKYEPSHRRPDILKTKLPVVFWGDEGVGKDVKRIQSFVNQGAAKTAYSVFIDEGSYFSYRQPHPGSKWIDWGLIGSLPYKVSVLWSKVDASDK